MQGHADSARQQEEWGCSPDASVPSLTRLNNKVTQFSAQHLAQRVARQSLDENDGGWSLIVDQAFRAEGAQPTFIERGIVSHDDGRDPLTAAIIGQADHGGLAHAGAFVENALHNLWVYVEPAR